ncbi:MAG: transcriptional regulator [Acidobacteria bacterium]|jgi:transcriptional regulator with XRE-family HTH domain|nr:transcriptional regulator [Acidobacteriota bacterium]
MSQDNEKQIDKESIYLLKEMGQRFREFRESRGMTRKQMAIVNNTTVTEIIKMEQSKRNITTRRLCHLYKDIKINPHWLVTGVKLPMEPEEKTIVRAGSYNELKIFLEVPEVAEMITQKLKIAKLIFKDQIKKFNLPG